MTKRATYTTGEAAKICGISQQSIIRLFDRGHLKGFRLPGETKRHIPHTVLLAFMREHNVPLPPEFEGEQAA